jgi:exodeoxyribonuclease VII large subunit
MTGSVELDRDGASLLIRFPYREDLVAEVKALPARRWDPKAKTWRVPRAHAEAVYTTFARHLFEFAPEVMSLVAGTLGEHASPDGPAPGPRQATLPAAGERDRTADPAPPPAAADALTISALNARVRTALHDQFPEPVWVVGEIVDFDKQAGRKHLFFSLVEKARGEPRPRAVVEVALFERTAQRLLPRLAAGTDPLTLRDGIEIRALVRIDLYVPSGRFQAVIEDIDPNFTLGRLALSREQVLRELRDQGLAERNRSLGLPIPPLRVGVLTSPDSDGWSDFLRHLQEARVGLQITLLPVKVQGVELKPGMLAGLAWFARHAGEFDAVCILRGGGSRTDLAWFDDRELAWAVARHPLKILVGIGHQRDQSVLDVIAHSEKTPTAVAAFLARCIEDARAAVGGAAARLDASVRELLDTARSALVDVLRDLQRATGSRLEGERTRLAATAHALDRLSLALLRDRRRTIEQLARGCHANALLRLQRSASVIQASALRARQAPTLCLERAAHRLDQQAARLRLLDPRGVLRRGFALVRSERGDVLPEAARIQCSQTVVVRFRDGSVRARAESVHLESLP